MGLDYIDKKIENRIRISPSSMFSYYDNSAKWFKSIVLGQKEPMNENLIIGSLIHNRIERFYNGLDLDRDEEVEYLSKFSNLPEINDWNVVDVVDETWNYLYTEFLPNTSRPDSQEGWVEFIPSSNDDVFVGGSYDYLRGNTIGDYKTCSTLPTAIKTHHRIQAYIYSWILMQQGKDITNIEIVYIQKYDKGKPNPRYKENNKLKQFLNAKEPKVLVLNKPIDMEFMNKVLSDVKDLGTILSMCRKNKELVPLFFRTNLLSHF